MRLLILLFITTKLVTAETWIGGNNQQADAIVVAENELLIISRAFPNENLNELGLPITIGSKTYITYLPARDRNIAFTGPCTIEIFDQSAMLLLDRQQSASARMLILQENDTPKTISVQSGQTATFYTSTYVNAENSPIYTDIQFRIGSEPFASYGQNPFVGKLDIEGPVDIKCFGPTSGEIIPQDSAIFIAYDLTAPLVSRINANTLSQETEDVDLIVEQSPDLSDWSPLWTDSVSTDGTTTYYRLRLDPIPPANQ